MIFFQNSELVWGFNSILLFSFYIIQFLEIIKFLQWSFNYQQSLPNLYNDQTMVSHSASLQIRYQVYSNAVFCLLRWHQSYCVHSHMETSKHIYEWCTVETMHSWLISGCRKFLLLELHYYQLHVKSCSKSSVWKYLLYLLQDWNLLTKFSCGRYLGTWSNTCSSISHRSCSSCHQFYP
jgi:hypothetical protein